MLPKSYRAQESCSTCKMCYIWAQQDEDVDYYCAKDGNRPLSGICCSEEGWIEDLEKRGLQHGSEEWYNEFEKLMEAWRNWSEGRQVVANGMCDEHKPRNKNEG